MKRRQFARATLLLSGLGLAGCRDQRPPVAGPAGAVQRWRMFTAWPADYPGLGSGASGLAQQITRMSAGRLTVEVCSAGEQVAAMDVFDAVAAASAELGHSAAYYWKGRIPAAQFFTAVPFGLSAQEMHAWLHCGGGMALWDEVYAPHGIKPLVAGNTGMQMGGWFNREINSLDDLQGLRIRTPGLGAEVYKRLGATTVSLPGSEVFAAMQSGSLDATDWVSPYNDLAFGIHKAARYYYLPGWQEPQAVIELLINRRAWDSLPDDLQAIIENAARAATQSMLDEYTSNNARALASLQQQGIELRRFPDSVLAALRYESEQVLEQLASQSALAGRIWQSMKAFRQQSSAMQALTQRELYNWR